MANKSSTQLHDLIHSMSGAEKRYFKVFSERHHPGSTKNYVVLFDSIHDQKEYDDDALREQFAGEVFLRHFSIAKNRLYHQILRSLAMFHAESSVEVNITRRLHYAEILFSKALYNQCARVLATAEKLALEAEQWEALLLIVRRKKRLVEVSQYEETDGDIESIIEVEIRALSALATTADLWRAKSRIFRELFVSGQARNDADLEQLREVMEHAEESYASGTTCFESQYLILHMRSAFHFALGDYGKCFAALSENRVLFESHPKRMEDEPDAYIAVLTNLTYVAAKLNRFDTTQNALDTSRNLPPALMQKLTTDLEFRIFTNTYSLELAIANLTGRTKRAPELLSEISEGLEKWSGRLSTVRRAGFLHGMSTLYYLLGDRKQSLALNNELLNTIAIDQSEDQYIFAQIFHLILHYDADHFDLIGYGLKSLQRVLKNREKHFEFEEHFLHLLKQAGSAEYPEDRQVAVAEFLQNITPLEGQRFEKTVFEYFDFIAWAQAQLDEGSYADHVRRRAPMKDVL